MNTVTNEKERTISNQSTKIIGYFQFIEPCARACYKGGYLSYVLFNKKYSSDEKEVNNVQYNIMKNIPEEYKNNAIASTQTTSQGQDRSVPGASVASTGVVKCGRPGGQMCTLCDLISGFNDVIQYIMQIAIGVALLAMAIGGVLYVVSAGESGAMETAKSTITNAAIGFVIIFAAYLIVNTTIIYLGTTSSLGMNMTTSWGRFDCTPAAR